MRTEQIQTLSIVANTIVLAIDELAPMKEDELAAFDFMPAEDQIGPRGLAAQDNISRLEAAQDHLHQAIKLIEGCVETT